MIQPDMVPLTHFPPRPHLTNPLNWRILIGPWCYGPWVERQEQQPWLNARVSRLGSARPRR